MIALSGTEVEYAVVVEGLGGKTVEPKQMGKKVVASHPSALLNLGVSSYGTSADGMLSNGARLYDDMGHPEYSTPECRDLDVLVACEKGGERLMEACCDAASASMPDGEEIALYKNNTDHAGHTWGSHENYLVSPQLFDSLIIRREAELHTALIPFLVTRQLFSGAGRVGGEGGWKGYQLSQRTDFICAPIGLETTGRRPIVNTRDEPLADGARFRRLHLIMGDANMSEFSIYLKIGTTRLVLRLLEESGWNENLALRDPVRAMREVSRDFSGQLELENGRRSSPLDVQYSCLDAVNAYLTKFGASGEEESVLAAWSEVLDGLRSDWWSLADRLDWAIKLAFLESIRADESLEWDAPLLKELDIRYHDVRQHKGIFNQLVSEGTVWRLESSDCLIDHYSVHPPANTRASVRAEHLRDNAGHLAQVDWDHLISDAGRLDWPDPTVGCKPSD